MKFITKDWEENSFSTECFCCEEVKNSKREAEFESPVAVYHRVSAIIRMPINVLKSFLTDELYCVHKDVFLEVNLKNHEAL